MKKIHFLLAFFFLIISCEREAPNEYGDEGQSPSISSAESRTDSYYQQVTPSQSPCDDAPRFPFPVPVTSESSPALYFKLSSLDCPNCLEVTLNIKGTETLSPLSTLVFSTEVVLSATTWKPVYIPSNCYIHFELTCSAISEIRSESELCEVDFCVSEYGWQNGGEFLHQPLDVPLTIAWHRFAPYGQVYAYPQFIIDTWCTWQLNYELESGASEIDQLGMVYTGISPASAIKIANNPPAPSGSFYLYPVHDVLNGYKCVAIKASTADTDFCYSIINTASPNPSPHIWGWGDSPNIASSHCQIWTSATTSTVNCPDE